MKHLQEMPITTRSKDRLNQDKKEEGKDEKTAPKTRSNRRSSCVILKIEKPRKKRVAESSSDDDDENSNGSSSEESEIDDEDEEEFEIPRSITSDKTLNKKAMALVAYIDKKTVKLKDILESPIRLKHKAELFEQYFIYQNSMPNSEERMELRQLIHSMLKDYTHEYKQYVENKSQIKHYEKRERKSSTVLDMQYDILRLETSDMNKEVIFYKYMELKEKTERDDEYYKLKKWIKHALELPYDRVKAYPHLQNKTELTPLLAQMKETLDKELFGMKRVKEQILLFLHNKLMFPEMRGCCMGLVGPPGVGKTSIARCIATILDFPFQQISFGGIHNSEFLKGFDYTYVGSQPGEIAKVLMRMKYKNGIMFFDEYEKISQNNEIVSFLLHMSDFSQNHEYRDSYLNDLVIDLSCIWFIYSMNDLPQDKALQDRIFTVQIDGYNVQEKIRIMVDFLFPRHLKAQSLNEGDIVVSDEIALHIIHLVTDENDKGIRAVEQVVKDIINKVNFMVIHKDNIEMSFCTKKYELSYPVILVNSLVDVLLRDFKKQKSYAHMYI